MSGWLRSPASKQWSKLLSVCTDLSDLPDHLSLASLRDSTRKPVKKETKQINLAEFSEREANSCLLARESQGL